MPTTYAHYRFGEKCIKTLPENLKQAVLDNRELFDFGVHGPDIFFYDLRHKDVTDYGNHMHHEPGRIFFNRAIEVYNDNPDDKDAMMSYILGFLSHYTLDSVCHGYINTKSKVSEISHNKVEAEYDGHLMRSDGKVVDKVDRASSLKPNKKISKVMARFFPFDENTLHRTTTMQKIIISLLNGKNDVNRKMMNNILVGLKMFDYSDLIVRRYENEKCKDSNLRIDKLMNLALDLYPQLVESLINKIENNNELSDYFETGFDPEADTDKYEVLGFEEELNYIPTIK